MIFREKEEEDKLLLLMVVKNNHHLKRSDLSELSLFRETFVFNVFSSFKIRFCTKTFQRLRFDQILSFSPRPLKVALKREKEREERERERRVEGRSPSPSLFLVGIIILIMYVSNRKLVPLVAAS